MPWHPELPMHVLVLDLAARRIRQSRALARPLAARRRQHGHAVAAGLFDALNAESTGHEGQAVEVASGLRLVQRSAAICTTASPNYSEGIVLPDNRSKFNVALGVESRGFCLLSH